jgi:hypothetical protein
MRKLPIFLLLLLGCGSGSRTEATPSRPPKEPDLENPVVFNLDLSTPLPLLTVLATREETAILRARYKSFFAQMGPADKRGPLTLRSDAKGSLPIPWNFYLRNFASPYPVRLMGVLPDGTKEVIHEETF